MHQADYTVLIIDDNSDDITLLERFLSRNLIPIRSISIARKGHEGLERIQNERPDFVIVGDSCPDMNRTELLNLLAEITSAETLPILCLVNDEMRAEVQALRAKQIGVVKKAMLTPEKLRDAMLALMEQAEIRAEKNRAEMLFALLSEHSEHAIALTDAKGVLVAANKAYLNLFQLETSSIGKQVETQDYADIFSNSNHASCSKTWLNDEKGNSLQLEVKRLFVEERGKRSYMLSIYKVLKSDTAEQSHSESSQEMSANADETKLLRQLEAIQKSALQTSLIILRAKARRLSKANIGNFTTLLQEHNFRTRLTLAASECMSVSESHFKVSTAQYVASIFDIFQKSPLMQQRVVMKYEGETFWIELSEAIFIGLILGELITNALQHAFTSRGGVLSVSFIKEKDGTICMTVTDSGVGMPFKVETKPPDAMGLMIVGSLTKKLNGRMEVKRQIGTTIRIFFSEKKLSEQGEPETETSRFDFPE